MFFHVSASGRERTRPRRPAVAVTYDAWIAPTLVPLTTSNSKPRGSAG
jgi:hypothetical protein